MKSNLSESMEDYLEAIFILQEKNRVARVKEIAEIIGVKMPSVTVALKFLKEKGLIEYEKNSYITLTEEGIKIAQTTLEKHNILTDFFSKVLNLEKQSEQIACHLEHVIDISAAKKIEKLTNHLLEKDSEFIKSLSK